jgi:hypothetical protein
MSTDPANGGSSAIDGDGGDGGTVATPSGQIGESSNRAGGGGGAVGRIRINTRSGQALGGTFSPLSSQGAAAID